MIKSMTGFGRGEAEREQHRAVVEMRSVNSRFCEVNIRVPKAFADREADIQKITRSAFNRGRINVQVILDTPLDDVPLLEVNVAATKAYRKLLADLATAAGVDPKFEMDHILRFPDVFTTRDAAETDDHGWNSIVEALSLACQSLAAMRASEGAALFAELGSRIDSIQTRLRRVEEYAPSRIEKARERLNDRLAELLADERLDPERIDVEITLLADKLDVTEECVRLQSHLDMFRTALASDDAVGRKLNFLSQEMNREINTIGSKANDAELSHIVVEMKEDLEKIREQVENVE